MTIKVSVVIPVYNPGPYIEDCIASLLRQSLPQDAYEVVFVNDGSTDGTPARLDALAAEHPNIRVIHQENSGWAGKPRNVGIEASTGEFVMFVDNDDWLSDEALERMYAYGVEHAADVVVGKMAGRGRPVPRELFRTNRPRATVKNAPLIDSLTPHKMFRRAFLEQHGLRFPEGRRRLEDHVFVTEAYLTAGSVAVLSDYVCYHHVRRDDAANAGFQQLDPVGYFRNLREALDVVAKYTEPGPLRDKLHRRWFRNEMIERMRGRRLLAMPDGYRQQMFQEMHKVVVEYFGPGVLAGMAPMQQIVGALITADSYRDVEECARWEKTIGAHAELTGLTWQDGALEVEFTAGMLAGKKPVQLHGAVGEELVRLPAGLDGSDTFAQLGVRPDARVDASKAEVVVRERSTAAEFYQPVEFSRERVQGAGQDDVRMVLRAKATVSPETAAGGEPLTRGVWDVVVRVHLAGWTKDVRLGSARSEAAAQGCRAAVVGEPARLVLPYWTTPHGNLSLDIGRTTGGLTGQFGELDRRDLCVLPEPLLLEARLPVWQAAATVPAVLHLTEQSGSRRTVRVAATLAATDDPGRSLLRAERPEQPLTGGNWGMAVSLGEGDERPTRLPFVLTVAAGTGALTIRAVPERPAKKHAPFARRFAPRFVRRMVRKVRGQAAGSH
ncbi:glycosyltransferase family 2 protein [Streptomyces sp. NPDC051322]|uniref:glycosyltransferase family 2 protein n=1 Tax=Streptomyces sp. NPDC051322 TaxID=3154645 RepID=UPI00344D7D5C